MGTWEIAVVLDNYFKTLIPFTWTTDKAKGFDSFESCLNSWVQLSKKDSKVKLENVFGIGDQKVRLFFNGRRQNRKKSATSLLQNLF